MRVKFASHNRGIEIVFAFQKHARRLNLDTPRRRRRGWKVPFVLGDDNGGPAFHRRGEDMTVLGMVGHLIDERLISRYPGIAEVLSELANEVSRLFSRDPDSAFEISNVFGDDFVRPARDVKARLFGKTKKRISKGRLDQNAGVQNNEKIRSHSSSAPSGRMTVS